MGPVTMLFHGLIDALEHNKPYELIKNLIYKPAENVIIRNAKEDLIEQDTFRHCLMTNCINFILLINIWVKLIWVIKHWHIIPALAARSPVLFVQ